MYQRVFSLCEAQTDQPCDDCVRPFSLIFWSFISWFVLCWVWPNLYLHCQECLAVSLFRRDSSFIIWFLVKAEVSAEFGSFSGRWLTLRILQNTVKPTAHHMEPSFYSLEVRKMGYLWCMQLDHSVHFPYIQNNCGKAFSKMLEVWTSSFFQGVLGAKS